MTVIDTNILVHAVNLASPCHLKCLAWIDGVRVSSMPFYTTWPIVYEFLRVVTHPRVLSRPLRPVEALDFVDALLRVPTFEVLAATPEHAKVARRVIDETPGASGNLMHDLHTVVLMREHGIRQIATNDKDFTRFVGIQVVDPTQD